MPEPITSLVAQSSLPASGQVFSETLRLSILPARTIIRLQLGARSQKTVDSLKVAGRSMPVAINSWSGDDPVTSAHRAGQLAVSLGLPRGPGIADGHSRRMRPAFLCRHGCLGFVRDDRGGWLAGNCPVRAWMWARSFDGDIREFRLHAHAACAVAGRAAARDVRAIRVPGGPVCGAVALQLARGCGGRSGLTRHFYQAHAVRSDYGMAIQVLAARPDARRAEMT